jgi:hypothetical protein
MPGAWTGLTSKPEVSVAIGALVFLLIAAGVAARLFWRRKPGPSELERRRRGTVQRTGKMGDGEILDFEGASIVYSYHVAGISYTTSQEMTGLEAALPVNPTAMIGPVVVKFDPRNPANSIVVCEEWSGLRRSPAHKV